MVVVLLAQAGGFSTRPRFLILENHELVDIDWEEEAASMQGTDRPGPALSGMHLWTMQPARATKNGLDR